MIRGSKRKVETQKGVVSVDFPVSIHNRFKIEVVDSVSGRLKKEAVGYNTLCENFFANITSTSYRNPYAKYIHYGTGDGTPSVSDTSLFQFYGAIQTTLHAKSADIANNIWMATHKAVLNPEDAVGIEITEVGLGYDSGASTLCTHALLKDMNGNTISILKSDTDIINIYATVFIHFMSGENNPSLWVPYPEDYGDFQKALMGLDVMYSPSSGTFTVFRHAELSTGSVFGMLMGDSSNSLAVTQSQSSDKRRMDLGTFRFGVDKGNLDGGCFLVNVQTRSNSFSSNNTGFSLDCRGEWWGGTEINGEAVGTGDGETVDFSTKFSLPENAKIYVDGVQVSATVDKTPLGINEMGKYFILLSYYGYPIYVTPSSRKVYTMKGYYSIYFNPFYEIGIKSIQLNAYTKVYVSNDLETWDLISESSGVIEIPETHRNKKYWKIEQTYSSSSSNLWGRIYGITAENASPNNIHLASPPADGAVITADYHTKAIAKDSDHVFDLTLSLVFGEYTE